MDAKTVLSLANKIASIRAREVEGEFFREVTKRTFDKWFGEGPKGGRPYLDAERHGGYMEGGRYYMLSRDKYTMYHTRNYFLRKKGYRLIPEKKEMSDSAKLAQRLYQMGFEARPIVSKTGYGCEIRLGYSKRAPYDYKNYYSFDVGNGAYAEGGYSEGKKSSLDRIIRTAIAEWATENGFYCAVTVNGGI